MKSQCLFIFHPDWDFLAEKIQCEHLITDTVTNAEIWMSGNLISDDTSLWSLNILKEISYIKIHREFRYANYATRA